MKSFFNDLLTDRTNVTYDAVKVLAVATIVVALGLEIFAVVMVRTFDVQAFGIGMGAVFLAVGGALRLNADTPPGVTASTTTNIHRHGESMKQILLAAAFAAVLSLPASALQQEGNLITLTDDEVEVCEAGGGCVVATRAAIIETMRRIQAHTELGCAPAGSRT